MLTPKQIKIFEAFLRKPYKELSYKEIKGYSNEKSNSIIQKAVSKFLAENLITKIRFGKTNLYSVNLKNNTVFSYFDIITQEKISVPVKNSLKIISEELSSIIFKSLIIFGSYADSKQNEKSDFDIAVFVNSAEDKKKCELSIKSAELKTILPMDAHVFTKNEMLIMLKDKYENLGKQIAYKHIVIHNPAIFYSILEEGMNNGFKIVYS